MPSITLTIEPGGPIVKVLIGVSVPRSIAQKAAGEVSPQSVIGNFLIDTGASNTCVDPELIAPLNLPQIGKVAISTPSTNGTQHYCETFDASIIIVGTTTAFHIHALPVITTHLRSQGIDGLIGRDILDKCTLIYIGTSGIMSLSF